LARRNPQGNSKPTEEEGTMLHFVEDRTLVQTPTEDADLMWQRAAHA
jgi:hypothetical protein